MRTDHCFYLSIEGGYGGVLFQTAEEFGRFIGRAEAVVSGLTLSRHFGKAEKMAACAVAETMQRQEETLGIASESVGAHSVSYVQGTDGPHAALISAAKQYLKGGGVRWV
jgi:hypothetical protein